MTTELCSGKCDASRGTVESAGGHKGVRKATFGSARVVQDGKGTAFPMYSHGRDAVNFRKLRCITFLRMLLVYGSGISYRHL